MNNIYFAASNSYKGFISYFDKIFSPEKLEYIYILKGGPGVGKSSLMKKVSKEAEKRGIETECFLCSSSPSSYDGIIIDRRIAILDGTAPHTVEPGFAGIKETIVNLGACWKTEQLKKFAPEIISLMEEKKKCYAVSTDLFASAGCLRKVSDRILEEHLDKDKMKKAIIRLLDNLKISSHGKSSLRVTEANSGEGLYELYSFENMAEKTLCVKDLYGSAKYFLYEIKKYADENKLEYVYSPSAFDPDEVIKIYFPNEKILFKKQADSKDNAYKSINMNRFVNLKGNTKSLKFYENTIDSLKEKAYSYLKKACSAHEKLEKLYYIPCTDYTKVEKMTKDLINDVF